LAILRAAGISGIAGRTAIPKVKQVSEFKQKKREKFRSTVGGGGRGLDGHQGGKSGGGTTRGGS